MQDTSDTWTSQTAEPCVSSVLHFSRDGDATVDVCRLVEPT